MSQGPLCPNLSQKVQAEVSQMANHNLSRVILLGGLSVNLNHLKTVQITFYFNILFKVKVTPPDTHPPCTFFNQVLHMWYTVCLPGFSPTPFKKQ